MNYELVWPEVMIHWLSTLYLRAWADGLGNEFTRASAEIEELLEQAPHDQGESRDGDDRILIVLPLSVTFRIDEVARRIYIVDIGYSPRH